MAECHPAATKAAHSSEEHMPHRTPRTACGEMYIGASGGRFCAQHPAEKKDIRQTPSIQFQTKVNASSHELCSYSPVNPVMVPEITVMLPEHPVMFLDSRVYPVRVPENLIMPTRV